MAKPSGASSAPPSPPPAGWTLAQAAEALCPATAAAVRKGGEALRDLVRQRMAGWAELLPPAPEEDGALLLAHELLAAIASSGDLVLTGVDPELDLDAPRRRIEAGRLAMADRLDKGPPVGNLPTLYVNLDLPNGAATIQRTIAGAPADKQRDRVLLSVRVEAAAPALLAGPAPAVARNRQSSSEIFRSLVRFFRDYAEASLHDRSHTVEQLDALAKKRFGAAATVTRMRDARKEAFAPFDVWQGKGRRRGR